MKTNRNLLIAALGTAALFTLASEARAQRMAPQVIASPKFQQQLNESANAAPTKALVTRTGNLVGGRQQPQIVHHSNHAAAKTDGIVASPKHREVLNARAAGANASATSGVGYKATGADGITASPKHRQALDENTPSFQIAPVK
jgi:acyl-CoA hydrolase